MSYSQETDRWSSSQCSRGLQISRNRGQIDFIIYILFVCTGSRDHNIVSRDHFRRRLSDQSAIAFAHAKITSAIYTAVIGEGEHVHVRTIDFRLYTYILQLRRFDTCKTFIASRFTNIPNLTPAGAIIREICVLFTAHRGP